MPSRAAEKPKKRPLAIPPAGCVSAQLYTSIERVATVPFTASATTAPAASTMGMSEKALMVEAPTRMTMLVIWKTKMSRATPADSVIPARLRMATRASTPTVAHTTWTHGEAKTALDGEESVVVTERGAVRVLH